MIFFLFKKCPVNNLRDETTYIRSFILKDSIIDPVGDFRIWQRRCSTVLKGSKTAGWISALIWSELQAN